MNINKDKVFANPVERLFCIGQFYEELARHLFGGEINHNQQYGEKNRLDLHIWEKGIGMEVKGANHNDGGDVDLDQLENHSRTKFPFDKTLYVVFFYKISRENHQGLNKKTGISKHTACWEDVVRFLCARTFSAIVIESQLILKLLEAQEIRMSYPRPGQYERNAIHIGRMLVRNLAAGNTCLLGGKNFIKNFQVRTIFHQRPMLFELLLVLPHGWQKKFKQQIKQQLIKSKGSIIKPIS